MQSPLGFRFATAAALIDREGYTGEETEHLLREWERYARYAMMSGKSPASTAEHLARFERYQRGAPLQRDPRNTRVPNRRMRHVSDAVVDEAIADDLRRRATMIFDVSPSRAQEIIVVARIVQNERDPDLDKPRLAARVVTQRHIDRDPDDDDEDTEGFRCSMCKARLGGFSIMTPDGRAVCSRRCKDAGVALPPGNPFLETQPRMRLSPHSQSHAAPLPRTTERRPRKR